MHADYRLGIILYSGHLEGRVGYGKMRFRWALQKLAVRMGEGNHSQGHVSRHLVLVVALLILRRFQSVLIIRLLNSIQRNDHVARPENKNRLGVNSV